MRKTIALLSLVALWLSANMLQASEFRFVGKLSNAPEYGYIAKLTPTGMHVDTLFFGEDGAFDYVAKLDKPNFYILRVGRTQVHIYGKPGATLKMEADYEDFPNSIVFSGKAQPDNAFLLAIDQYETGHELNFQKAYAAKPDTFNAVIDGRKTKKLAFLSQYLDTHKEVSEKLAGLMKNNASLTWVMHKINYPSYYKYFVKEEADIPPDYFDFLGKVDLNDTDNLMLPAFSSFLESFATNIAETRIDKGLNPIEQKAAIIQGAATIIDNTFNNDKIRQYAYFNTLKQHLDYRGANGAGPVVDTFFELADDESLKNELDSIYAEVKKLASGKTAPDFSGEDLDGKIIALSDLRGDYVYVDVWATWCRPCLAQIPKLKSLEEEYTDKGVTFVSISIDSDKARWEEMVEARELKGVQIFAEGAWDSGVVKKYGIKGIPRFMLVGPEGKIIDANAPRPTGGIGEVFQSYQQE